MLRKLYHLSLEKIEVFKPKIPENILPRENNITKRICLSNSIENCLSAVYWFGSADDVEYCVLSDTGIIPIYVYEFLIDDSKLKTPNEVYKENVIDALYTNEYWYIGEEIINPVKSYIINLKDYTYKTISIKDKETNLMTIINKIENIKYEIISDIIFGNKFLIKYKKDLPLDVTDIIKSAFDSQLPYIQIEEMDNLPNIINQNQSEIMICCSLKSAYYKEKLINYMNNQCFYVTDILEI